MKCLLALFLILTVVSCNSNKKQTLQNQSIDTWQIENYTNEWGEKTHLSFVLRHCKGKVSNSFATDAPLDAELIINKKDISIKLYEYGDMLLKEEGKAFITVRDKDKKEHREDFDNSLNNGELGLWGKSQAMVRSALLKGGRVMFRIQIKNDGVWVGTYIFEVPNADGLKEALSKTRYYK